MRSRVSHTGCHKRAAALAATADSSRARQGLAGRKSGGLALATVASMAVCMMRPMESEAVQVSSKSTTRRETPRRGARYGCALQACRQGGWTRGGGQGVLQL